MQQSGKVEILRIETIQAKRKTQVLGQRESRVTGDVFMQVQCNRFGVAALEAPRGTVKQSVPLLR